MAKIARIKMCQTYRRQYGFNAICAMPTNLYGPGDNFDLTISHVLTALIRKFHEAKESGRGAERHRMGHRKPAPRVPARGRSRRRLPVSPGALWRGGVNVRVGEDVIIRELAELVRAAVGFEGELVFGTSKPDGTVRKLLDVGQLRGLGWRPTTSLPEGIRRTVESYFSALTTF